MTYNTMEYKALGGFKDGLFNLILRNKELSEHFIDLMMPTLDDNRLDKIDNFSGGDYVCKSTDGEENVKLQGRLFDVPFIYSCVTKQINVVCIDTNISKNNGSTKEMLIELDVMCHKDNLELDKATRRMYNSLGYPGKNRLDIAVAILGDMLNHTKEFGLGEMNPIPYEPVKSYYPNQDFFGKILRYTCSDFMIDYAKRSSYGE